MKRCGHCEHWLPLDSFSPNRSRRDGLQSFCRECQRAYMRAHYEANRPYYLAKARRSNDKRLASFRQLLRDLKSVPCADCNATFPPYVMDFDHVGDDKLINVSMAVKVGRRRLLAEVAKCEVVCANCHRQRTQDRLIASRSSSAAGGMLSVSRPSSTAAESAADTSVANTNIARP